MAEPSKFVVIHDSLSFSLLVKCSEKFLSPDETLMFVI